MFVSYVSMQLAYYMLNKSVHAVVTQTLIKRQAEGRDQNNVWRFSVLVLNRAVILSHKDLLLVKRYCTCSKVPLSVFLVLQSLTF